MTSTYPSHLVKPHDTVELLIKKIARWRAVERHTPRAIGDEDVLSYLDRAMELVEAAVAKYESDPDVRAEAEDLLIRKAS